MEGAQFESPLLLFRSMCNFFSRPHPSSLSCINEHPAIYTDLPTVPLLAGQSRFFSRRFFLCGTICNAAVVPRRITQLNVITEIPFDFSQKYQTVGAAESPCYSVFWNTIDFCRLYTSKKISMWALPTVPLFAGKSRFFTRNVPLKTFSRLAGLIQQVEISYFCRHGV